MPKRHVAVDIGSSSTKIVIGELTGKNTLEMNIIHKFPTPRSRLNNHLRINTYSIFDEILSTLSRIGDCDVVSLGVDSWASDFALLSLEGYHEGLPVFYRDGWGKGKDYEIEQKIGYDQLYSITGQQRKNDTTLAQLIALKAESPDALKNRKIVFMGDLIMHYLTGKIFSEFTIASYSQLFSMSEMSWANKVFDTFELPCSLQSPIVYAGDTLGFLQNDIAKCYSLGEIRIIAPAVHDTSSAALAVSAKQNDDWAFISTGSWFLVSLRLDKPMLTTKSFHNKLTNTGLAFKKTLLKRNVTAMWLLQECMASWSRRGLKVDYSEINAKADAAQAFFAVIDTDDECFYNPDDMVFAIIDYLRRTSQSLVQENDIGQIARIIYESIALKCTQAIRILEEITVKRIRKIFLIGGACRIELLNQFLANATQCQILAGPTEATSMGNILMQAYGSGLISDEGEISDIVRSSIETKLYEPCQTALWEKQFDKFNNILEDINGIY